MSSRRSKATRSLIKAAKRGLRRKQEIEKHRKPGETDEMMMARMQRDLGGFTEMVRERQAKEAGEKED